PDMADAGQWLRVAQQVSLSSSDTIELLMQDPLPPAPPGGYDVIEVTSGYVNNSFDGNTIDLSGKSSAAIKLDGEDFGTRIAGNRLIGGTTGSGTAIVIGAEIGSAPSANSAFSLPADWTPLPNLGATIEGNTIQDSAGGVIIGVEHTVNYWESRVTSASESGRVFVTAPVTGNTLP